jgi:HEAT repeat protein
LAASGGAQEAPPLGVERVFLTELQARELFELLRGLGLFGPERLPGLRGDASAGVRRLELSLGQASKEFAFALPKGADWFEQAVQAVRALAERNRWQAFCAADSPAERLGQWREQAEWWDEEGDALARERRLKQLVLAWLERAEPSQRQAGVDELARLGQRQGVLDSADFPRLLALLRAEPFLGARARALVDLAVVLARDPAGSPQDTALDPARAAELNALLIDRFEAQAAPDVARILRATGESAVLAAAADERALVRAMAVNALADSALAAAPQAREPLLAALRERLQDADARVQSAAHLAIGRVKDERALSQVTIAARLADPPVRASALRALGALGGENALDALVVGMANREFPEVALGATWGLAELGDPRSASLLVSLLAKDPDDPLFEAAQSGLLRLGPAAHEALFKTLTAKPRAPRRAAALLLSRQGVCDAAPALISLLAEDPLDERVSLELAVLSARDLRQEKNPAQAWWDWWDGAVQDDSLAWFLGALQRQGAAGLERSDFAGSGQGRAREFLLDVLQRGEVHWVERARRELARMLGREIAPPPPSEGQRERYFAHLREELSGLDS